MHVQRASKAANPQHGGPRVRDRAEFRAGAEPAVIGLAQEKPLCCCSCQHCEPVASPPCVAAPPVESPLNHAGAFHTAPLNRQSPSQNQTQDRTSTAAWDRRGSIQPYLEAVRSSAGSQAARGARRAHGSRQLSCRRELFLRPPRRVGLFLPAAGDECSLSLIE